MHRSTSILRFSAASFLSLAVLSACGEAPQEFDDSVMVAQDLTLEQRTANCQADPRVVAGLVPLDVCVGADFFFRETFNGNGRTCASCHRVEQNFTIDPAFIA